MTLRSRLVGTYAAMIFFALLLFAVVAIAAIDRTARAATDSGLQAEAHAGASLIDYSHGELNPDPDDKRQFLMLIGAGDNGLIADAAGNVVMSSAANPPAGILALVRSPKGFRDVGAGERALRAFVLPMTAQGKPIGTAIVWRATAWIEQTDRTAAIAFGTAALLLALIAVFAGGLVTQRALEDAFARQRRFTADASHELRAPLAVIRAEADLALRRERTPQEYREAMESVAAEADRLESLIGDLLSAARAESRAAVREPVDVAQIVRDVAARIATAAAAKEANLRVEESGPAAIIADRSALERALLAVAHNAVKFAPIGGMVRLAVDRTPGRVQVVVEDNGPGFTPDALEHALERFWRDGGTRVGEGGGLGLAIAKAIVEASNGSIEVANSAQGAVVRMRFPAANAS